MDIDSSIKNIKSLYQTLFDKPDVEVSLNFRGVFLGQTKPWLVRVGDREASNETHEGALLQLTDKLTQELSTRIRKSEEEVARLKSFLNGSIN